MKKLSALIGVAGVLFATNLYASFDGTVALNSSAYSWGNGGEFTAVTSGLGTFQTFCIEYNEEFGPGNTYQYNQNSGAVAGGAGVDAIDSHTGLAMDNISIGTAYLYSQFRNGGLGTLTASQAGQVQNAIWYLENEITLAQLSTMNGVDGTAYYNLAKSGTGTTDTTVFNDSLGAYGVIALNLFDGAYSTQVQNPNGQSYNVNQDQLAIVPEPTTMIAGALLLLPFGASTLRILRKNRVA
jgi:predicted heme/steroid binding protein